MHTKNVITRGTPVAKGVKVLIMLHGRGANAEDILSLSRYLDVAQFALIAPQATGNTWYPYSFLAPQSANEPWLSSAIDLLKDVVSDLEQAGVVSEDIYLLGFSQGACLTLEYSARHARRYGGIVAFTGGLIGDKLITSNYSGDFANTPIFIGSSNPDPHVPVDRVEQSVEELKKLNAKVSYRIYNGMGHTINEDEIRMANAHVFVQSQHTTG